MKKFLRAFFGVLLILITVLMMAWVGFSVAKYAIYDEYLTDKGDVCTIPALNDGFVAQGIAYLDADGGYIHSGYWGENISVSYVKGDDMRVFIPLDETGKTARGHGGGISAYGDFVYVASDDSLLVYKLADLLAAKDGDSLSCVCRIPVDNQASFCFAENGKMFVGEFYRAEVYEVDRGHAYTTPEGEEHRAIVSCYNILEDGMLEEIPDYWISLPAQVQGFAVNEDGVIAISCSWGLSSSTLSFYTGMKETGKTAPYANKEVPIYYIGSANLIKQVKLPAFSEELDVVGDRVIISYESACNKYIVGKLFFAYNAESYPIPKP